MGEQAIHVGVGIHKTGGKDLSRCLPHGIVRETPAEILVASCGRDETIVHPRAPPGSRRRVRILDEKIGQNQ
jgi:hypothetical protein